MEAKVATFIVAEFFVTFKGYWCSGEDNPNAQYKSRFNQMKYVNKITNGNKEIGVKSQMSRGRSKVEDGEVTIDRHVVAEFV